jgi:hypothetical protein
MDERRPTQVLQVLQSLVFVAREEVERHQPRPFPRAQRLATHHPLLPPQSSSFYRVVAFIGVSVLAMVLVLILRPLLSAVAVHVSFSVILLVFAIVVIVVFTFTMRVKMGLVIAFLMGVSVIALVEVNSFAGFVAVWQIVVVRAN